MHTRTLSKTVVSNLVVLSVLVVLGASLPQRTADTSAKTAVSSSSEALQEAPGKNPGKTALRSSTKQKRPSAKPLYALATASSAPAGLLAVVQQPDIKDKHQKLADQTLRALPAHCRTYLKNFYVQYVNVKQRGLGGKSTVIIDGTSGDNEFVGLLVHECGHVTHGNLPGTSDSGISAYRDGKDIFYKNSPMVEFFSISWMTEEIRNEGSVSEDFVSGYAQSDAFEDFSETFAMYILHRPSMRERAKTNASIAAKLAWMEKYLPVEENTLSTADLYKWDKKVPWDVTKLAYTLSSSK